MEKMTKDVRGGLACLKETDVWTGMCHGGVENLDSMKGADTCRERAFQISGKVDKLADFSNEGPSLAGHNWLDPTVDKTSDGSSGKAA